MSKIIELRNKTKSIARIHSATKAMQVAAAAQLKGIQSRQRAALLFKEHYSRLAKRLKIDRLLPRPRNPRPLTYVYLLNSQRGFCGGFNAQLSSAASRVLAKEQARGKDHQLIVFGKNGRDYKTADITPAYQLWQQGKIEKIIVVFNEFVSMLVQRPRVLRLLPFDLTTVSAVAEETILDLPLALVVEHVAHNYARSLFDDACLQTFLGEVGSRLLTMRGATENSKEMLKTLKIRLNKARQAMITIELSEIISAFETLEEELG